jgi:hypothetical protein
LVRGFEDADEVVGADGPIEVFQLNTVLLAELVGPVGRWRVALTFLMPWSVQLMRAT